MNSILPEVGTPFINATQKYLELTEYLQSTKTSALTHSELENFLSGFGAGVNASATGRAFKNERGWGTLAINNWF